MNLAQAEASYVEGLHFYEHHDYQRALLKFREAVEIDGNNPKYLSTLGVTVSRVQKNHELAAQLCSKAIRKKHNDAQLYINLADVYIRAKNKTAAIDNLITGYKYTRRDQRIIDKVHALGLRRPSVLRFLNRRNPFNMLLGRIRHYLMPLPGID